MYMCTYAYICLCILCVYSSMYLYNYLNIYVHLCVHIIEIQADSCVNSQHMKHTENKNS